MMKKVIWYVGGKSAGHIMPLLTLAHEHGQQFVIITTHRALDKKIVNHFLNNHDRSKEPIRLTHYTLYIPDIIRKKFWLYPWHAMIWLYAWVRLFILFFTIPPAKVVSTGGLCAVPVFLWAKIVGVPCELFELNAVPGAAVRFLAQMSNNVSYCYKTMIQHLNHHALHYRPYPIRKFSVPDRYYARLNLGLDPAKKTICFLGGSQGSRFINDFALRIVSHSELGGIQIIHQAGRADHTNISAWYTEHAYQAVVIDYYPEIELLYSAADMIVCRAGAGTLWELEYMNIPTCIIPLETSETDHQLHNAYALCAQKPEQFFMVRQADAEKNSEHIIAYIQSILVTEPKSQLRDDL